MKSAAGGLEKEIPILSSYENRREEGILEGWDSGRLEWSSMEERRRATAVGGWRSGEENFELRTCPVEFRLWRTRRRRDSTGLRI